MYSTCEPISSLIYYHWRVCSSVGRAFDLHSKGPRFETWQTHHCCRGGGIGRRARLKILWLNKSWEFDSLPRHHIMNKNFLTIMTLFMLICLVTVVTSFTTRVASPAVLGSTSTAAKLYDDGNGVLYLEYSNPQDVYSYISSWQGKYPGKTIYSSSQVSTGSPKYFATIFTYTGK